MIKIILIEKKFYFLSLLLIKKVSRLEKNSRLNALQVRDLMVHLEAMSEVTTEMRGADLSLPLEEQRRGGRRGRRNQR